MLRNRLRRSDRVVDRGQPGLVGEQPADGNVLLPVRRELRPVLRDGCVEVQLPALGEQERARGRHGLGGGVDDLQGVVLRGSVVLGIGDPAPQVDHFPTVQVHGDGRAHLLAACQVGRERRTCRVEPRCGLPADFGHASSPSACQERCL